mmetsp:Transcript_26772/g.23633  ORF Transcript_26772/g.23633 Transcript_26772/m.23633 type:complete len:120 (-) Transcript_26772:178-537(-)
MSVSLLKREVIDFKSAISSSSSVSSVKSPIDLSEETKDNIKNSTEGKDVELNMNSELERNPEATLSKSTKTKKIEKINVPSSKNHTSVPVAYYNRTRISERKKSIKAKKVPVNEVRVSL